MIVGIKLKYPDINVLKDRGAKINQTWKWECLL